jgi:hypothetical protein
MSPSGKEIEKLCCGLISEFDAQLFSFWKFNKLKKKKETGVKEAIFEKNTTIARDLCVYVSCVVF